MEALARLEAWIRTRSRTVDRVWRFHDRAGELHAPQMAGAITLMAFLSLLPLLLVGAAVLGFWSAASSDLTRQLVDDLGLEGSSAAATVADAVASAEKNRRTASVLGLAGLLWTGLGLVGALQSTWNACWQVQGRGLRDRAYGVLWLAGGGALLVVSVGLTVLARFVPAELDFVTVLGGILTGTALFWWTAWLLPNRDVGWRPLLVPALVGAVGFEALKLLGTFVVPRLVARASALYGSLGVVFALLAWLLVLGRIIVYVAVLEVVRWEARNGTVTATIDLPALPDLGSGAPVAVPGAAEPPAPGVGDPALGVDRSGGRAT